MGLAIARNGCCWAHVVGVLVVSVKNVEVVIEVDDGRQNIGPKIVQLYIITIVNYATKNNKQIIYDNQIKLQYKLIK